MIPVWCRLVLLIAMLMNGCRAFGKAAVAAKTPQGLSFWVTRKTSLAYPRYNRFHSSFLWSTPPDDNDVKRTWEYKPFEPPPSPQRQRRRPFSSSFSEWKVPSTISIPEDRLDITFARSSGAGGQNVNKVNTKVDIRFHVMDADWIPLEVRQRLSEQCANRINKEGYLNLAAQEHRTQTQNRRAALDKLRDLILQAYPRPKIRKERTGISKAAKARNKEDKRKHSQTKENRRRVDF